MNMGIVGSDKKDEFFNSQKLIGLTHQANRQEAMTDYIAMMLDVELPEEGDEDVEDVSED